MKFLIDENIPFANEFFQDMATIERFSGRALSPEQLIDADALLVRSITKVNEALLSQANRLKFVGTATIGEDHIDKSLLQERGIGFSSAPGCNAVSVAEYVISAILILAEKYHFNFFDKTIAIVGIGNIGKALQEKLMALGVNLLLCDPIRQKNEQESNGNEFVDLKTALTEADIVTLHTPLTRTGQAPTYHLINQSNLELLKEDVCLINACRGEVVDNAALLEHIRWREKNGRKAIKLVLDVWEDEPNPMQALLPHVDIASAHIAGYSLEGKSRGTEMLYQRVCQTFGIENSKSLASLLPQSDISKLSIDGASNSQALLKKLVHLVYDVRRDDALFRALLNDKGFDWLRKNYPIRREWSSLQLNVENNLSNSMNFSQLGFAI